jgi:hypothetical protein
MITNSNSTTPNADDDGLEFKSHVINTVGMVVGVVSIVVISGMAMLVLRWWIWPEMGRRRRGGVGTGIEGTGGGIVEEKVGKKEERKRKEKHAKDSSDRSSFVDANATVPVGGNARLEMSTVANTADIAGDVSNTSSNITRGLDHLGETVVVIEGLDDS